MTVAPSGRSIITYRIGGREYPLKTNRQCKVCMSPYRFDIEEAIVAGRVYKKIVDSLPEGHGLTIKNVQSHYYNDHMPLAVSTTREIVERRAQQVGKRIEDSIESLIDGMTLLDTVVQKTFEAVAAGEIKPELTDGIRAARILAALGEFDQSGLDQHAIVEAFTVYQEQAQSVMSPEQFAEFGRLLENSPVLRALAARYDGEEEDTSGQTVPGQVVKNEEAD